MFPLKRCFFLLLHVLFLQNNQHNVIQQNKFRKSLFDIKLIFIILVQPVYNFKSFVYIMNTLPHKVKTQEVHFRLRTNYTFFYLGRLLKKLADDQ